MEFVVTFIGQRLDNAFAESMAAALAAQGLAVKGRAWKNGAVELQVNGERWTVDGLSSLITGHCPPDTDYIIQPFPKPRYKLLISDMDSTMIACECLDELADYAGKKAEVAAITERAMRGELEFEDTLKERVAMLAGLPESVLQRCYDERVQPMPGAKELLAAHKKAGGTSVLVSGGFTFFTSRVASELGFDEHHGNTFEIKNGKLTGNVIPPILGKHAKLEILRSTCKKLGITTEEVVAIGDGSNDLPMLLAAGLGIAYHAKPVVQKQVINRINHGDLASLIFLTY